MTTETYKLVRPLSTLFLLLKLSHLESIDINKLTGSTSLCLSRPYLDKARQDINAFESIFGLERDALMFPHMFPMLQTTFSISFTMLWLCFLEKGACWSYYSKCQCHTWPYRPILHSSWRIPTCIGSFRYITLNMFMGDLSFSFCLYLPLCVVFTSDYCLWVGEESRSSKIWRKWRRGKPRTEEYSY